MAQAELLAICSFSFVAVPYSFLVLAALFGAARARCAALFERIRRSIAQEPAHGPAAEPVEEPDATKGRVKSLVRQRVMTIQHKYVREALGAWEHVCGISASLFLARLAIAIVSNGELMEQPPFDGYNAIILTVTYLTALVVRKSPRLFTPNSVWLVHSWFMFLIICYGARVAILEGSSFVFAIPRIQFVLVVLSLAYPKPLPNFLWNATWAALSNCALLLGPAAMPDIPVGNILMGSCAAVACLSYGLRKVEQLQESVVRSELEANGHLRAKATVEKVLSNMCDAVVELDQRLDIKQSCPKLAGLLLKTSAHAALKGEAFPSLILKDDDRERFEEFVDPRAPIEQEHGNVDEREGSVYLSLRDASGAPVSVQLFHSCHQDAFDELCHVVGVRETQEEVGVREIQVHPNVEEAAEGRAVVPTPAPGGGSDDDAQSVISVASSSTQGTTNDAPRRLAPVIAESSMLDPVSALLNPMTNKLIGCTTGFKAITGPLFFGYDLRRLVINRSEFEEWMQAETNGRIFNDKTPEPFELVLVPSDRGRRRPRFEFHAEAHILMARGNVQASEMGLDPSDDDGEQHGALCVLALVGAEPQWLPPSHRTESGRRDRRVSEAMRRQDKVSL